MEAVDGSMNSMRFTTCEMARLIGVHANTIRFYEKIGLITKPERQSNGYRVYTQLHLEQCRLVRRAMKAEVLQNGLRDQAVQIVRLCAALNFVGARAACREYSRMILAELDGARAAIRAVEEMLGRRAPMETTCIKRLEAAMRLGVTPETLRTWERSGLLRVTRRINGCRVYGEADMRRLRVIRTLRCANYSLSAILRLMEALDQSADCAVETALNAPRENEDIVTACDRLMGALQAALDDAQTLLAMITRMEEKFQTLQ